MNRSKVFIVFGPKDDDVQAKYALLSSRSRPFVGHLCFTPLQWNRSSFALGSERSFLSFILENSQLLQTTSMNPFTRLTSLNIYCMIPIIEGYQWLSVCIQQSFTLIALDAQNRGVNWTYRSKPMPVLLHSSHVYLSNADFMNTTLGYRFSWKVSFVM